MIRLFALCLLGCVFASSVAETLSHATEVQIVASSRNVVFHHGNLLSPTVTVLADSVAPSTAPEILIYQIGLSIVPASGASGTIGFSASTEADNYLFSGASSPLTIPFLPQLPAPNSIDVSDSLILSPAGVELLLGQPKGIVDLTFAVSEDAAGRFDVVLAPFTGSAIGGSSWASELVFNPMDANAFQNAQAGSSVDTRVLTSIIVVPEPSCLVGLLISIAGLPTALYRNNTRRN